MLPSLPENSLPSPDAPSAAKTQSLSDASDPAPSGPQGPGCEGDAATLPPTSPLVEAAPPAPETTPPVTERAAVPGYEILSELGRGGMGVVYQARQVKLSRMVALKMILSGAHAAEAELIRFRTEAEAIARLQHPNIVQIYEVGEQGGLPYFSLEFCAGGSLERKLKGTPLPPKEAAALVETLARAMDAAHRKGVIHRDLKPANVLFAEDGTAKITDFGLAKKLDEVGQTASGSVMGTPSYMAPEQAGGGSREVGPPADVYALGAILYELLTGRPPFKAATPLDTVLQVLSDEPVPPTQLQSRVPRDLETICLKCLWKEPARRYASAAELAEDLHRFQAGLPIAARPIGWVERLGRWYRRNPAVAALLALVLLSLLLGGVVASAFAIWANENARAAQTSADQALSAKRRAEDEKRLADAARQLIEAEKARVEPLRNRAEWLAYGQQLNLASHAWQDNDIGHGYELLDACRWDFRGWEYDYLRTLFDRNQRSLALGEPGILQGIAFSPDGKHIATAEANEGVRIWDRSSLELVQSLKKDLRFTTCLAYSADGKRLAAGNADGSIRVWQIATGNSIAHFKDAGQRVNGIAFSPNGRRLASATAKGSVKIWDLATGSAVVSFQAARNWLPGVTFSPDGKYLATGGAEGARVWDAATGKLVSSRPGKCHRVAFSPDGAVLAVSTSPAVVLWAVATGKDVRLLKGHQKDVSSVAFSPDGRRLASSGYDRLVLVWDVATGRLDLTLKGHTGLVEDVAFSPDGLEIASFGREGTVKLWKTARNTENVRLEVSPNEVPGIRVTYSHDRRLVAWPTLRCQIKVFDLATCKQRKILAGHDRPVICVAFSPDGRFLASGAGGFGFGPDGKIPDREKPGEVKVWDLATGREVAKFPGSSGKVLAVAFSPDGKFLTAGADANRQGLAGGNLRVWEVGTWRKLWAIGPWDQQANPSGLRDMVGTLAFSPDSKHLASAGPDFEVNLWDVQTGRALRKFLGHKRPARQYSLGIEALAFSPDCRHLASAGDDRTVRLWDVASGAPIHVCRGHTGMVYSLAFSPDGRRLASVGANATGEGATVKLWNPQTGNETIHFKVAGGAVAFSEDGRRLFLVGGGPPVRVWDASLQQKERTVRGGGGPMQTVAFSPNGKFLACGSGVNSPEPDEVRVLDATTGQVQFILNMSPRHALAAHGSLTALAFSPDSIRLAALDGSGTLKVWDMRTEQELLTLGKQSDLARQIRAIAFSPDYKFLAGGGRGLQLWDATTGAEVRKLAVGDVSALAFSPDGARVAVAGTSGVKICEVLTGRVLVTIKKQVAVSTISFSPDGTQVAFGAEAGKSRTIEVWDARRGTQTATLSGHTGAVTSVTFSPDSKRLASTSLDRSVRVWNLATRQAIQTLRGHAGVINQVVFSPDGQRLASASTDGTVKVWNLKNER